MYVTEDFGEREYLDGIKCQYCVMHKEQDRPVAYVFDKTVADWIARQLTEGEKKSVEYDLEYKSYVDPLKIES